MMEHRLFTRCPAYVGATVESDEIGRRRVRVRDASPAGVFLEMPTPLPRRYSRLDFVVAERIGNVRHLYRLASWVVHIAGDGVGVEFDDSDSQACHDICRILGRRAHAGRTPDAAQPGEHQEHPPLSTAG